MKKVDYAGNDLNILRMKDTIQENFRELFLMLLQQLSKDPTDNLKVGMKYYNTAENKFKILTSTNPVTWETMKFE